MQPGQRAHKISDGGNGLDVVVSPCGSRSFRDDYRLAGRRETLTIGHHEPVAGHAQSAASDNDRTVRTVVLCCPAAAIGRAHGCTQAAMSRRSSQGTDGRHPIRNAIRS